MEEGADSRGKPKVCPIPPTADESGACSGETM